jgi:hypothetical protein
MVAQSTGLHYRLEITTDDNPQPGDHATSDVYTALWKTEDHIILRRTNDEQYEANSKRVENERTEYDTVLSATIFTISGVGR